MVECLIFGSSEEMKKTLEKVLADFPTAKLSRAGTLVSPYQVGLDLGAIDEGTFFGWACETGILRYCFSLVMMMLDTPQPEWMRRHFARLALEDIRIREAQKQLPDSIS